MYNAYKNNFSQQNSYNNHRFNKKCQSQFNNDNTNINSNTKNNCNYTNLNNNWIGQHENNKRDHPHFQNQYCQSNYYQSKHCQNNYYENYSEQQSCSNEKNEEKKEHLQNNETPLFEILGLKLYFDDILIICLLFFLYQEGIQDKYLFISLILLLIS